MTRIKWTFLWFVVAGAMSGSLAYGDPLTLTLNPASGSVSGAPGAIVGWGFTLTNTTANFAVVTGADFCGSAITSPCSTPLGVFNDFISQFNFTVINPNSSLSQALNLPSHTGIGTYAINPIASPGSTFAGQVLLTFDLYDSQGPGVNLISSDNHVTSAASVSTVSAAVPEPAMLTLLSSGLLGLYMVGRRRSRMR